MKIYDCKKNENIYDIAFCGYEKIAKESHLELL